jgi:preprotein translocase subunit SecF
MVHLMRFKLWYIIGSLLIIVPGLLFLLTSGLKLGIDFTGGGLLEYQFSQSQATGSAQIKSEDQIKQNLAQYGLVTTSGPMTFLIKTKPMEQSQLNQMKAKIASESGQFVVRREENVGPVIGKELEQKALIALLVASGAIVLYITWAFRKVPKPASSWRFGVSTIIALLHDVLVLIGVFAILGHYWGIEVDSLFVTALLTVIGFSVHDTIVVFDRIRENLPKYMSHKFQDVADISVTQTLARSLNTSLTVILVLLALLLFGGETIRWFVVALLVGIISGTYSSIFNATAILVWWEERLGH